MEYKKVIETLDRYYDLFWAASDYNTEVYLKQYKVNTAPISAKVAELVKSGEVNDHIIQLHLAYKDLEDRNVELSDKLEEAYQDKEHLQVSYDDLYDEYKEYLLDTHRTA